MPIKKSTLASFIDLNAVQEQQDEIVLASGGAYGYVESEVRKAERATVEAFIAQKRKHIEELRETHSAIVSKKKNSKIVHEQLKLANQKLKVQLTELEIQKQAGGPKPARLLDGSFYEELDRSEDYTEEEKEAIRAKIGERFKNKSLVMIGKKGCGWCAQEHKAIKGEIVLDSNGKQVNMKLPWNKKKYAKYLMPSEFDNEIEYIEHEDGVNSDDEEIISVFRKVLKIDHWPFFFNTKCGAIHIGGGLGRNAVKKLITVCN